MSSGGVRMLKRFSAQVYSPLLAVTLSRAGYATRAFTGGGYLDAVL